MQTKTRQRAEWVTLQSGRFGKCCDCGWSVEGQQIEWNPQTKQVRHLDGGECLDNARWSDANPVVVKRVGLDEKPVVAVIPDGRYTIVRADETWGTYRVSSAKAGSRYPGRQKVARLIGPDNGKDFINFAWLDGRRVTLFGTMGGYTEWRQEFGAFVQGDQVKFNEAGLAYALKSGNCRRCGRELTVPASITQGFGPICVDM